MKFIVEGITFGHCVRTITAAIRRLDSSAVVDVNVALREVRVTGQIDANHATRAIEDAGYLVVSVSGAEQLAMEELTGPSGCCGTCNT